MQKIIGNNSLTKKGLKRKDFFIFSGILTLGYFVISNNPLKFFQKKTSSKENSIKIQQHPDAVSRKSIQVNNA